MLVRERSLVGPSPSLTALNIAVILSLCAIGFCAFPPPQAFAETTTGPKKLFISRKLTHFVAVDGSDTGPGTAGRPWATVNYAANHVEAGDTVFIRGGRYVLHAQVRPHHSGRSDAWISFIGYPGEKPILDAQSVAHSSLAQGGLDNGAFQLEAVSYIRIANLTVINSHDAGFTIRDSSNIELINNSTKGTFSSGIAVWDTNHEGKATKHIKILGNTITQATTWDLAPAGMSTRGEPPQEALSIDGAMEFEVAYNYIYDSGKEGIDIKGTSRRGEVHHNLVTGTLRQGIYVDAWFGEIRDIKIFSNVVHRCRGAGIALSVEDGVAVENVTIHNNLIFDNAGSGLYFSRWGVDHTRRNIQISNNVFYHNGYGPPQSGQIYYWLTGGLYLYSTNVHEILIRNNIFSGNRGFQIGYSDLFLKDHRSWQMVAREKAIHITSNLIDGRNTIDSPIEGGGALPDRVKIYAVNGSHPIFGSPMFRNPAKHDFALRPGTSAGVTSAVAGAYAPRSPTNLWWKLDFPPKLLRIRFN